VHCIPGYCCAENEEYHGDGYVLVSHSIRPRAGLGFETTLSRRRLCLGFGLLIIGVVCSPGNRLFCKVDGYGEIAFWVDFCG